VLIAAHFAADFLGRRDVAEDPETAVIMIENAYDAINQIRQTTVRNVVGRAPASGRLVTSIGLEIGPRCCVCYVGVCRTPMERYLSSCTK
jgi:hypothetical protein